MAKSSVVVDGDIGTATRLSAEAVRAAGGTVSASIPGEPVRFSIKRPGSWRDNKNTPYEGTASVLAVNSTQSRIDVETTLAAIFYIYIAATCIGCLILTALFFYVGIVPLIFAIIISIYVAVMAQGTWAQEMADAIVAKLPAAAHVTAQAPVSAPPAGTSPPPSAPAAAGVAHTPSSAVMEDLKKLGELHSSGVLTDAEFEAKKAELLKRL
ncbi:MAG TPA: SHOCT domain-containing protein [Stellaceae bacterium]|nr:SHOCT domain-containing protein [Stellaceae bacterium]